MKIIVIGAVAAGTSALAKARRNNEQAEISVYEKGELISYSSCGLPYYIGGNIDSFQTLTPRDVTFFKERYAVEIKTAHEVLAIDPEKKEIQVKDLKTNRQFTDRYDALILATGATPSFPLIKGMEQSHVYALKSAQDALTIKQHLMSYHPKTAVIVGSGFIGLEMLEGLISAGLSVTLVEKNQQLSIGLDPDMAHYFEHLLLEKGVNLLKQTTIQEILQDHVVLQDGTSLSADLVLLATGVRPNVTLAKKAGIELGTTGAIKVDSTMKTSQEAIYACGDCIETFSRLTQQPMYHPLGSTANKTGRIAGDVVTGGTLSYQGSLGTSLVSVFDLTVARTGLSEDEARQAGFDPEICHTIKPDKALYFKGKELMIKAIADKKTQKLLGIQAIGYDGVDKRIDVFATLITYGATVDELFHLDLAYAPQVATTKDPVHYVGMALDNALNHGRPLMTPTELHQRLQQGEEIQVIDTRVRAQYEKNHLPQARHLAQSELRDQLKTLNPQQPVVTYCNKGVTGNAAQNILINHGFKCVYNLSGGQKCYQKTQAPHRASQQKKEE